LEGIFTSGDAWAGGFYELAILLKNPSVKQFKMLLKNFWGFPEIEGIYLSREAEPEDQKRINYEESRNSLETHLYGVAKLPNGKEVNCVSIVIQIKDYYDAVIFAFPMGGLNRAYPVGAYPFDDGSSLAWRDDFNTWLGQVAEKIYSNAHFDLGIIGHEPLAEADLQIEVLISGRPPKERWEGYLLPENGYLRWYPPTEGIPFKFGS
jgi:hypothetical protein